jgi:hypothetical protein
MRLFRVLFAFDVLGLLVLVWFFVDGLRYASSGGDYFGVWLPLLAVPVAVLAGSWALSARGRTSAANVLLGMLAAPFLLYLLFIGLFVVLQPDFR